MRWSRRLVGFALIASVMAACSSTSSTGDDAEPVTSDTQGAEQSLPVVELVEQDGWGELFEDENVVGTFAVREVGSGQTLVWDRDRAERARLPASTFKILNSMVILQTGVIGDVDELVPWDGVEREVEVWNQDHSLRSGIEVSAVWMYQALARRVGAARMAERVAAADYGNTDIGGGIDEFWLRGDLRISAVEQLDFLERMVTGGLPFDDDVVTDVREIIVREQGDDWSWSHKTGTALAAEPTLGWLVGTTDVGGRTWVFAMNVDLDGPELATQIDPQVRQTLTRRSLEDVGALPPT
ncbi:MAG: penicillin-binding transpeptidase domain-containing protein [Actinomycetota bacterium]